MNRLACTIPLLISLLGCDEPDPSQQMPDPASRPYSPDLLQLKVFRLLGESDRGTRARIGSSGQVGFQDSFGDEDSRVAGGTGPGFAVRLDADHAVVSAFI